METVVVDAKTGRKCYLDVPSDPAADEEVTFVLNLHGGGSVGRWQREYFPAYDYVDQYRLVVATPSAATKEPIRHWAADADDDYLVDLVESILDRLGRSRGARLLAGWPLTGRDDVAAAAGGH